MRQFVTSRIWSGRPDGKLKEARRSPAEGSVCTKVRGRDALRKHIPLDGFLYEIGKEFAAMVLQTLTQCRCAPEQKDSFRDEVMK